MHKTSSKPELLRRGAAVTGDLFSLSHPSLALSEPFTSHVEVVFEGITHQVLTVANTSSVNYANTVGVVTVHGLRGHVMQSMDNVETSAAPRWQLVLDSPTGSLVAGSYLGAKQVVELGAALRPQPTKLGMIISPSDAITGIATAKVAISTALGILELTPLTTTTIEQLPPWQGTPVRAGELYAGTQSSGEPYLTLVTDTCRVVALVDTRTDRDQAVATMADLDAQWTS